MRKYHFVITGGHHNSALVVAKELQSLGHRVSWIGHRNAAHGDTHDSAEYLEVTAAKFPFYNLVAGKSSLRGIWQLPLGFIRATFLLSRLKPDVILSFGSYLGLNISLASRLFRTPLFIHEQTVVAGKANKLAAIFAKRIYLTWESSARFFPKHKTLVTGLPLRPSILSAKKKKLFNNTRPTILVMGGKQGSHVINSLIIANLDKLLPHYNLIHQTGTSSVTGDYDKALAAKEALPDKLASSYRVEGYITEAEIGSLLSSCDLYLGRSGAHTSYELAVLNKRSLLIPLLYTHSREQLKNAHLLVKSGIAKILPQSALSFPHLKSAIKQALILKPANPLTIPHDASTRLIKDCLHALSL